MTITIIITITQIISIGTNINKVTGKLVKEVLQRRTKLMEDAGAITAHSPSSLYVDS